MATTCRRLVMLTEHQFSRRDFERFDVVDILDEGVEFEVWNLGPLLSGQWVAVDSGPADMQVRHVISYRSLYHSLRESRNRIFVLFQPGCQLSTWPVLLLLGWFQVPYAVVSLAALPPIPSLLKKLPWYTLWRRFTPYKIANAVFRRLPPRLLGIPPARYIFLGGTASEGAFGHPQLIGPLTERIWVHALDYELCRSAPVPSAQPTAVFLDQFLPFHWEYHSRNRKNPIQAEDYYRWLRESFRRLEARFGVRLVVAAHPTSRYEGLPDYFGGRETIVGRTAVLVRDADFVITHGSTAVNFAVLYSKPVLMLTSRDIEADEQGVYLHVMANELDLPIADMTKELPNDLNLRVNEAAYQRYRERYIKTTGSPQDSFGTVIARSIKRLGTGQ